MKRRDLLAAVGASGAAGISGCIGAFAGGATCDEDCDIGMSTNAFRPKEFTTSVGETVTWKNTSSRAHTVTGESGTFPEGAAYFASGGFDSEDAAKKGWNNRKGAIEPGQTFEHTFETPGRYGYICIPHVAGGMVGTIVVEE